VPEFYPHALRQMQKRGISRAEVVQVLENHETSYPSHEPGRDVRVRTIGGRRIAVVIESTMPDDWVVTAFVQPDPR
jgi:hypothetical protein